LIDLSRVLTIKWLKGNELVDCTEMVGGSECLNDIRWVGDIGQVDAMGWIGDIKW